MVWVSWYTPCSLSKTHTYQQAQPLHALATLMPPLIHSLSTTYPQVTHRHPTYGGAPLGADGPCALTGSGIRLHSVRLYTSP